MVVATALLVPAAFGIGNPIVLPILDVLGVVAGALIAVGSIILLFLRVTDPKLKPYTAPVDLLNLVIVAVLGILSVLVAMSGMERVAKAVADLVRVRPLEVSPLLATQMAVATLFLFYLPATRMVHFFSKYFTYHEVRWDDRPREAGSALDRRLREALDFGVDWSAAHARTGKTWAEVATTLPENKTAGE
jgi:nitrate reductase gamma subunit